MTTKAEQYEEQSRNGDELALTKAACDSTAITINGKPFHSDGPVSADDLADLLNASLKLVGQTAIFEFDDGSYLVAAITKAGEQAYIAAFKPLAAMDSLYEGQKWKQ